MTRGLTIAIDELNAQGGALGRSFALVRRDDESLPTRGVLAARELIYQGEGRGPVRRSGYAGVAGEYPSFDNAETFVKRLVAKGVIVRDVAVDAALHGAPRAWSVRSEQRHFLRAAGVTRGTVRQIERARYAVNLLRQGASILDVVDLAGYFDQAHLTKSLKYRIGQTPAEVVSAPQQLSFLYKTTSLL